MSPHRRLLALVCLLSACLLSTAAAQQWSEAFGIMGLDGPGLYDGEGYCLGKYQGDLIVGGWFEEAGGVPSTYIARWDGEAWDTLDGGVDRIPGFVLGTAYVLYVGGPAWQVDADEWTFCAYWGGADWHPMPGLLAAPTCGTMVGDHLWVGGSFSGNDFPYYPVGMKQWFADQWLDPDDFGNWDRWSDEAHAIADGYNWIHVGGDIMRVSAGNDTTWSHVAWSSDDGHVEFGRGLTGGDVECMQPEGADLWIGGSFTHGDGVHSEGLILQGSGGTYSAVNNAVQPREVRDMTLQDGWLYLVADEGTPTDHVWRVRRYSSGQWSEPYGGDFTDGLNAIFAHSDGDIYVGGFFKNGVVRWDNSCDEWVHLGGGIGTINHDRNWFQAITSFEGDIIAAGNNIALPAVLDGQYDCQNVVRWDGEAWHRMAGGIGNEVTGLAVHDGELYAGVKFGGASLEEIMRWDGEAWQPGGDSSGQVLCLAVHGDDLVAGGHFTVMEGVDAGRVAAFDGDTWRALGTGMDSGVRVLFEDDGVLYAGGQFTTADGSPAARVARWNGAAWEAMGAGFDDGYVHALSSYGGEIYAGGSFTASDGVPCAGIARWDGAAWQPLGDGVGGDLNDGVTALRGTTTGLYVGGDFTTAGGIPVGGLALWDGAWSDFSDGGVSESTYYTRPTVRALHVHEGDLWVGGAFTRAGGVPSYSIGVWEDGALVPTLLTAFTAVAGDDGSVDIGWQVTPTLADAEFRLAAVTGDAGWQVPYSAQGDARFAAHDTARELAGAETVRYTLSWRQDDRWRELDSTRVLLMPPAAVRLTGAAPNPFNPATRIGFVLDRDQDLDLAVYDLAGRRLATLASGRHETGAHAVTWRGCDDAGRALPSGTYLVRLVTDGVVRSQKVLLAR